MPIACWTHRARRSRSGSGTTCPRSLTPRPSFRHGRSCASGAQPSPPPRRRTPSVPARRPRGLISILREIGPPPDCLRPSRARSDPAIAPPSLRAEADRMTSPDIVTPTLVPAADGLSRELDERIAAATKALLEYQKPDGHWVFELEADATIPAEYVLLRHYLGEPIHSELERKIAVYLRRTQGTHGGWPLFHDGTFDMSASVKAYFALKMIGDSPEADHMRRARAAILARGGAAGSNVFTRILLSLYGVLPWRSVPVMPVEIMLLPKWFPFHIDKISYWGRTVIVPLLVLMALKPRARNPLGVAIDELFVSPPEAVGPPAKAPHQKWSWFLLLRGIDAVLRMVQPLFPRRLRQRAIDRAVAFVRERLNGEDGLGAIFPAIANTVMMYDVLGYPKN